jgi:hypothetical protein
VHVSESHLAAVRHDRKEMIGDRHQRTEQGPYMAEENILLPQVVRLLTMEYCVEASNLDLF